MLAGASLYVDPSTGAARQAAEWRGSRPADAERMDRMASQAHAVWMGDWSGDARTAAAQLVEAARADGSVPVLVVYNIPSRDCGGLSGGGGATPAEYRHWISELAAGIGDRPAVVILEPDALAAMDCLDQGGRELRLELLREAGIVLKRGARTMVYVDAGHTRWHAPSEIAARLTSVGIGGLDGFSLNVSNFIADAENVAYGTRISELLGGTRFVVDSGRNGAGAHASDEWCNPEGRALGRPPTTSTGNAVVDAFLWIKRPGESDGACNGGPSAGQWWAEYALDLAVRAGY